MIGDFFTEPLQGAKFRKFRDVVMNCDGEKDVADASDDQHAKENDYDEENDPMSPSSYKNAVIGSQECVGANVKTKSKTTENVKNESKAINWANKMTQTDGKRMKYSVSETCKTPNRLQPQINSRTCKTPNSSQPQVNGVWPRNTRMSKRLPFTTRAKQSHKILNSLV